MNTPDFERNALIGELEEMLSQNNPLLGNSINQFDVFKPIHNLQETLDPTTLDLTLMSGLDLNYSFQSVNSHFQFLKELSSPSSPTSAISNQLETFLDAVDGFEDIDWLGTEEEDNEGSSPREKILSLKLNQSPFEPLLDYWRSSQIYSSVYSQLSNVSLILNSQKSKKKQTRKDRRRERRDKDFNQKGNHEKRGEIGGVPMSQHLSVLLAKTLAEGTGSAYLALLSLLIYGIEDFPGGSFLDLEIFSSSLVSSLFLSNDLNSSHLQNPFKLCATMLQQNISPCEDSSVSNAFPTLETSKSFDMHDSENDDEMNEDDLLAQALALSMEKPQLAAFEIRENANVREKVDHILNNLPGIDIFSPASPFCCREFWVQLFADWKGTRAQDTIPVQSVIFALFAVLLQSNGDLEEDTFLKVPVVIVPSNVENLALLAFLMTRLKDNLLEHCKTLQDIQESELMSKWFYRFYFIVWSLHSVVKITNSVIRIAENLKDSVHASINIIQQNLLELSNLQLLDFNISSKFTGDNLFSHILKQKQLSYTKCLNGFISQPSSFGGFVVDIRFHPWNLLHSLKLSAIDNYVAGLPVFVSDPLERIRFFQRVLSKFQPLSPEDVSNKNHMIVDENGFVENSSVEYSPQFYIGHFLDKLSALFIFSERLMSQFPMKLSEFGPGNIRKLNKNTFIGFDTLSPGHNESLKQLYYQLFDLIANCHDPFVLSSRPFKTLVLFMRCLQLTIYQQAWKEVDSSFIRGSSRVVYTEINTKKCHPSIMSSQNLRVANHLGPKVWATVILTNGFLPNTGIYEWSMRIDNCSKGHIFLGIVSSDFTVDKDSYVGVDRSSWGLIGTRSLWHNKSKTVADYGTGFGSGSIIILTYNSDLGTLSFRNPEVDWGVAFENLPKVVLFPAFSLHEKGDKLTVLQMQHHIVQQNSAASITKFWSDTFLTSSIQLAVKSDHLLSTLSEKASDFFHPLLVSLLPSLLGLLLTSKSDIFGNPVFISSFLPIFLSLTKKLDQMNHIFPRESIELMTNSSWNVNILNSGSSDSDSFKISLQFSSLRNFLENNLQNSPIPNNCMSDYLVALGESISKTLKKKVFGVFNWPHLKLVEIGENSESCRNTLDLKISLCGNYLTGRMVDNKTYKISKLEGIRCDPSFNVSPAILCFRLNYLITLCCSKLSSLLISLPIPNVQEQSVSFSHSERAAEELVEEEVAPDQENDLLGPSDDDNWNQDNKTIILWLNSNLLSGGLRIDDSSTRLFEKAFLVHHGLDADNSIFACEFNPRIPDGQNSSNHYPLQWLCSSLRSFDVLPEFIPSQSMSENFVHDQPNIQILDDYILSHVGHSPLLRLGGEIMSKTRKSVLKTLITHSGLIPVCVVVSDALASNTLPYSERPLTVLIDIWRAASRVIEYIVRVKQEMGMTYEQTCRSLNIKLDLLNSINISRLSLLLSEELRLSEKLHLLSDKWYSEVWLQGVNSKLLINETVDFLTSSVNVEVIKTKLVEKNLCALNRALGYKSLSTLINRECTEGNSISAKAFAAGALYFVNRCWDWSPENWKLVKVMKHRYDEDLECCAPAFMKFLQTNFEECYSLINQFILRSSWAQDYGLLSASLICWNILISPKEHVFLSQLNLFRNLQTVLDEIRSTLKFYQHAISENKEESQLQGILVHLFEDYQLLGQVALSTVYSLAAQIAGAGESQLQKHEEIYYSLRKAPSGPDTLSKSLFDLVFAELFTAFLPMVSIAFPSEASDLDVDSAALKLFQPSTSCESQSEDEYNFLNVEDYIYKILRLLRLVADSKICQKVLTSPKWLSLLFSIIGFGNIGVQRRVLRLLQRLLSVSSPGSLQALIPDVFLFRELARFDVNLDNEDILQLPDVEVGKTADNIVMFLFRCITVSPENPLPFNVTVSTTLAAEVLLLVRVLFGIPSWRTVINTCILNILQDSKSLLDNELFLPVLSTLGGSFDKKRVGGFVLLKPFTLLGTAENFATKLAAASHSTGMLIGMSKSSSTAEIVLMERMSKLSRSPDSAKNDVTVSHSLTLAGTLPIRSVRVPLSDILAASDIAYHPSLTSVDILSHIYQFLSVSTLSFLASGLSGDRKTLFLHSSVLRSIAASVQLERNAAYLMRNYLSIFQELLNFCSHDAFGYGMAAVEAYSEQFASFSTDQISVEVSSVDAAKLATAQQTQREAVSNSPLRELAAILSPFGRSMRSVDSAAQQAALNQMLEIGLPTEWCEYALKKTNYNVEMAINLCLEHGSEMNQLIAQEAILQSSRSGLSSRRVARETNRREERETNDPQTLIRQLLEMGFPPSWCARAMESNQNSLDAALGWILTHDEELLSGSEDKEKADENPQAVSSEKIDPVDEELLNPLEVISGNCQWKSDLTCSVSGGNSGFPSVGCRQFPVYSGKWYYELTVLTAGCVQVGWANSAFTGKAEHGQGVGDDSSSWAFDGWRSYIWHESSVEWGSKWSSGDVVGCGIDLDERKIFYFLNGHGEEIGMGLAFDDISNICGGLYPCCSFNKEEKVKFNFGQKEWKFQPPMNFRPFIERVQETFQNPSIIHDSMEELHWDRLPLQKKVFGSDEIKFSSQDNLLFFNPKEEISDLERLGKQVCILYSRLVILRCLRVIGSVPTIDYETCRPLFAKENARALINLIKLASAYSHRTKAYLQAMAILPPSSPVPQNLGPIFCVGGYPVLNELRSSFQKLLEVAFEAQERSFIDVIIETIQSNLALASKREFAEKWSSESDFPYILKTPSTSETEFLNFPSLHFPIWITSCFMNVVKSRDYSNFCLDPLKILFESWSNLIKSPVQLIKLWGIKVSSLLVQELNLFPTSQSQILTSILSPLLLVTRRIRVFCKSLLNCERGTHLKSEFLQSILELDSALESVSGSFGVFDQPQNDVHSPLLENDFETENDPLYSWEAVSGRCLADGKGWSTFTGMLALNPLLLPHQNLQNRFKTLDRQDFPPVLLPGNKVAKPLSENAESLQESDSSTELEGRVDSLLRLRMMLERGIEKGLLEKEKKVAEEGNYRIGTVEAIANWPTDSVVGSARVIRWDDNGETEIVRWGAEGIFDVVHVATKNGKIMTKFPPPPTYWQKLNSKFGSSSSFSLIFRVPETAIHRLHEPGFGFRCLLEWPDFCSVILGKGAVDQNGEIVVVEEALLSGPKHSGWEPRFGSSSWHSGSTLRFTSVSCRDIGKFEFMGKYQNEVYIYNQRFLVSGTLRLQQENLFVFDDRHKIPNVTLSADKLSISKPSGGGQACVLGSVGFSTGVHFWEFKIEQAEIGSIFLGISEKPSDARLLKLSRWGGLGFINNRTAFRTASSSFSERIQVYGDHFHTGDVVGVILDLNRGRLSFFLDGMKYGEHILSDLGDAFENLKQSNAVKPRTFYPIVGLSKALDRVTLTPRWFSIVGADASEEYSLYSRVYHLFSTWNLDRITATPLRQHTWIYRDAWRHYNSWKKGCSLRTTTRCKLSNLAITLNTSIQACAAASIKLGLLFPLLAGERFCFNKSCGRHLDIKEDAIILGAYDNQLWFKLDSQSGSGADQMDTGSYAWSLIPSDIDGITRKRNLMLDDLRCRIMDLELPRISSFAGGMLSVFHESGAVMRDGLEIDTSDVICTIPPNTTLLSIEQRINMSNIPRFLVFYQGKFGWISERMRGGSEETMTQRLNNYDENLFQKLKEEILSANPESEEGKKLSQIVFNNLNDATFEWTVKVNAIIGDYFKAHQIDIAKIQDILPDWQLDRQEGFLNFPSYLALSSTIDGNIPWSVEADMQLAEVISKTAHQLNIDPFNLSVHDLLRAIASIRNSPHTLLASIPSDRLIARAAILRVANLLFAHSLPLMPLKLPEEIELQESFGHDTTFELLPTFSSLESEKSHCLLPDCTDSTLCSPTIHSYDKIWAPPCFARRIRSLRRLFFNQTKLSFWESVIQDTTTPTALPQDEYEDPKDIKSIRINRIKATPSRLCTIKSTAERIKQSVFGQVHKELRSWQNGSFRRSYVGKGHGGQKRAFKVKFVGEGVNDYGGPYRALFEQIVDELRLDTLTENGTKISDRCLLPLLLPCPNRVISTGSNQDKYLLSTGTSSSPMNQELVMFLGKLVGLSVRHHLNMALDLSNLVWRPLVRLPLSLPHLETIDNLAYKSLNDIINLGSELEKNSLPDSFQPEDWVDLTFTTYLADGTRIPLLPGGESLPVNLSNWRQYVQLVEKSRLTESLNLYKVFRDGLSCVLPTELFPLFTAHEMEQLICGSGHVDIDLLRRCVEYEEIDPNSTLVERFWEVLKEFSDEERTLFLRFVWARSRMPSSTKNFPMNFKLQKMQGSQADTHLPHAQTCFFTLSIPDYSSKEIMKEKLLYAIKNSPNMDADVRLHTAEGWGDS